MQQEKHRDAGNGAGDQAGEGRAQHAHQNADAGEGRVISGSHNGGRCTAADVSQGGSGDHAQIPVEDLGQDEHDNHVQHQNQHAVNDPHGGGQQIGDGGGGGQQGDNSVQIDVGHLLHGGQLAQRSHGADQAQYSDKHGGAGALVEHIQTHVGQTSVHGGAHRLGDSGDQQGQTDQEDPVAGGSLAGLILLHLSVGGGGDGVQAGGIGLGGLVPLVGIADGQQQQGDPHGVAHGVQSQGAAVSAAVHGQGILHSGHVGGAADPGGVQSGHGGPGLLTAAQGAHKDRIEHQEAKAKG